MRRDSGSRHNPEWPLTCLWANDRTLLIRGYVSPAGRGSHVKRADLPVFCPFRSGSAGRDWSRLHRADLLALRVLRAAGELDGDGFEFGDELAQAAVGGEVGAEPVGFTGGEGPGDGAGAGFAGPGGVGAVQDGRAGVAVAAGPLAAGGAAGERAGQGDADPGELGLDLLVAAGQVVHGDRIPYPPRRRHPPPACLKYIIFQAWPRPRREDTAGAGLRMLPAGSVTTPALRGLARFAETRGVPHSREFLLDYDVIEAFCVAGLAGRASSTRGTYRSALYRLAEAVHGPAGQRATPFAGARAPALYSPGERAELAALAAARRDAAKRASALALVVFGIGAGLRPGELVALRGGDVTRHGRQVMVQVSGPAVRVVPVTSDYAGRAWELARRAGSGSRVPPRPGRPVL